jgi:hypothetical protein
MRLKQWLVLPDKGPATQMTDRIAEVKARREGGTWVLEFANGERWEVPISAIEGG